MELFDIYSKRKPYGYGGKVKKYSFGGEVGNNLPAQQRNVAQWNAMLGSMNQEQVQGGVQAIGNAAGGLLQGASQDSNMSAQMGGGALKGAASGAALGPIGMAGGAILGAIQGGMKASKAQQVEFQQDAAERMMKKQTQMNAADQYYNTFPEHGVRTAGFFAKNGGTIPSFMQKYGSGGAVKLQGASHENGGIDLNVNGKQVEAEGGEVIYDQPNGDKTIFSKRIGPYEDSQSYASLAEQMIAAQDDASVMKLAAMQGQDPRANQSLMANGGTITPVGEEYTNPDYGFTGDPLGNPLANNLFIPQGHQQELIDTAPVAGELGMDSGLAPRGSTPKLGNLTPFVDNIINAGLLNRTPDIPAPELEDNVQLQTKINVSDRLANIKDENRRFGEFARQNLRGGGKRAAMANAFAQSIKAENAILGDQARQETQLRNQQARINADIAARNKGKIDTYNRGVTDRADYINSQLSANAKNLTADLMGIRKDNALRKHDKANLQIVSKMFNQGLLQRNGLSVGEVMALAESGMPSDKLEKFVKKRK